MIKTVNVVIHFYSNDIKEQAIFMVNYIPQLGYHLFFEANKENIYRNLLKLRDGSEDVMRLLLQTINQAQFPSCDCYLNVNLFCKNNDTY